MAKYHNGVYFLQIDLDHFKSVSDNYGHGIGDQVLELVGRLLQGSVRTVGERGPDIVGRLVGREFGILLSSDNIGRPRSVAERFRSTLEKSEIETGAESIRVTDSFELADVIPREMLDQLYHRADAACYETKRNCRNQVSWPADAALY